MKGALLRHVIAVLPGWMYWRGPAKEGPPTGKCSRLKFAAGVVWQGRDILFFFGAPLLQFLECCDPANMQAVLV